MNDEPSAGSVRSVRLGWATLALIVVTIVSGDIVQATGSGAGCGESWPRCDGALLPGLEDASTAIEFTHRMLTVALSALVAWFVVHTFRSNRRGSELRRVTGWLAAFLVLEVLIGAALVAFGWVEDDASIGRVIADGLHVVNTFFLIGAAVLAVFITTRGRVRFPSRGRPLDRALVTGAGVVLLVAISGAINSLADTLFPADSVIDGLRDEFGAIAPLLVRMRILHPVLAIAGGTLVFIIVRSIAVEGRFARRASSVVLATVGLQFVVGILNIALLTPLETQVVHLLLADLLWISYLLLGFDLWRRDGAVRRQPDRPVGEVVV